MVVNQELEITHLPIGDLRPDPANPRRISDEELESLTRSIREFGLIDPIIARKDDKVVIGGHQRLVAARKLGLKQVPVLLVDLSEEQAKLLNLALNRISGTWDQELLARLMDENAKLKEPKDAADVTRRALVASALENAARAEELGLGSDSIVLSCKVSDVQSLITVYGDLAQSCDYALHLGLTEAGMGSKGIVASTAAMAVLLQIGIGDTIRVSLTPEPGGDRTREVIVAQEILQTMGPRSFTPLVTACPGCGRTTSTVFQDLAQKIQAHVRERMPEWRETYEGVETMSLAVMGCIVNGPGESKHADIGISLPGTGEEPAAPVFIDGEKTVTLRGPNIAEEFQKIVNDYIDSHYKRRGGKGEDTGSAPSAAAQ